MKKLLLIIMSCLLLLPAMGEPGSAHTARQTAPSLVRKWLSKDDAQLWLRWKTGTLTTKDYKHVLHTLRTEKLMRGDFPDMLDYQIAFHKLSSCSNRKKACQEVAKTLLMYQILGASYKRRSANSNTAYEDRSTEGRHYRLIDERSREDYMKIIDWVMGKSAMESLPTMSRKEVNNIIRESRGHEALYLLLLPEVVGAGPPPADWKEQAVELLNRGVPVVPVTPMQNGIEHILFSRANLYHFRGNRYLGVEDRICDFIDFGFNGRYLINSFYRWPPRDPSAYFHNMPTTIRTKAVALPDLAVLDTPLLTALYERKDIPLNRKLEMMEFLLQNGAPPFLGLDIFESSYYALCNNEANPTDEQIMVAELMLTYGGIPHTDCIPVNRGVCDLCHSKFIVKLASMRKDKEREYTLRLIEALIKHPRFSHICMQVNMPEDFAMWLSDEESIKLAKLLFSTVKIQRDDVNHAIKAAEKSGKHAYKKFLNEILSSL